MYNVGNIPELIALVWLRRFWSFSQIILMVRSGFIYTPIEKNERIN